MILVTGGTGFVGREVVRRLREVGHRVRVLTRKLKHGHFLENDTGIELCEGDVTDEKSLHRAMDGVTAVVHLVGIIAETRKVTFEQIHEEGTINVVHAAKQGGVKRFVMISALGTRAHAASRYHTSKYAGEQALRESGLDYTILRPSVIYGPNDHLIQAIMTFFRPPFSWLRAKLQPLPGGGESKVQPVYVHDVAEAAVRSLVAAKTIGKTYDVVGPEAMTWKELFSTVMERLGSPCVIEHLPVQAAVRSVSLLLIPLLPFILIAVGLTGWINEVIFFILLFLWFSALFLVFATKHWVFFYVPMPLLRWLGVAGDNALPRPMRFSQQIAMLEEDNVGDPNPLGRDLGLMPMSFEDGLKKSLPG